MAEEKKKRRGRGKAKTSEDKLLEYEKNLKRHAALKGFFIRFKELVNEKRQAGFTDMEIAVMINSSDSAIQSWEMAKSVPMATALVDIANGLGVSMDYLIGKSDCRTITGDIKIASETTHLDEKAIAVLDEISKPYLGFISPIDALNKFLIKYGKEFSIGLAHLSQDSVILKQANDSISDNISAALGTYQEEAQYRAYTQIRADGNDFVEFMADVKNHFALSAGNVIKDAESIREQLFNIAASIESEEDKEENAKKKK